MGCKVDSLVERHSLTVPDPGYDAVDEYLVARWTGADGRAADGYKTLTEWFNKRVLRRRYEAAGRDAGVHLDREYEVITGDDGVDRDELAADLAADGLDVDDLADELVSWSTMRHHLKDCLDAEKGTRSASTDWEHNTVRMARRRAEEMTRSVLSSLASKGRLPDAERSRVDVQVKLGCPECAVRVPFEDALERGYVCETHAESTTVESEDRDEGGRERARERLTNGLGGAALAAGVARLASAALLESPALLDVGVGTAL
ncbi:MAG: rod-determining factor RdfA [Halobacteriaceae archaeon]